MAHPLEQSYSWRTPATFASIAAVICVGALARGRVNGWLPALVLVIVLWAQITRVVAPVALLRGGHSALFRGILTQAPQADLDKGSQKTVALLKTRGLLR